MDMKRDDDVLDIVRDMWDSGSVYAQMYETRWAKNKKLVNSQHITPRKRGQSSTFVPKIEAFHQRKLADYLATFGGEDPVGLKETLTSTKEGARIMSRVLNYYITDAGGVQWDSSLMNLAHNALTYNFAPWILDWDRDVEMVKSVAVDVDEQGNQIEVEVEQEIVNYSHPTLSIIPPEDIRVDPSIGWDELHLATFGVIRRYHNHAYYLRMVEQGVWDEVESGLFSPKDGTGILNQERSQFGVSDSMFSAVDDGFIECWYSYYYDEETGNPMEVVTLADKLVLEQPRELEFNFSNQDGTDPFPFGIARVSGEPHELYSRAMPERLEGMQIETNAIRNQRRDNVSLVLNREKFMTPEAGVDPATLSRSFAGKVNVVKSKGSVWWDAPPDVTSSSYREEQTSVSDMESLVAENAQRMGAATQRKESATASKLMASNASTMMGLDLQVFAITSTNKIIQKMVKMIRQAAEPDIFDKAAAAENVVVPDAYREALSGSYRVTVGSGAGQAVKDLSISNASNMAAIIQSVYGAQANYHPIMKPMLEANGLPADMIIQDPQEQQQAHPSEQDAGGTATNPQNLTVQPNVQMSGGQFGGGQ